MDFFLSSDLDSGFFFFFLFSFLLLAGFCFFLFLGLSSFGFFFFFFFLAFFFFFFWFCFCVLFLLVGLLSQMSGGESFFFPPLDLAFFGGLFCSSRVFLFIFNSNPFCLSADLFCASSNFFPEGNLIFLQALPPLFFSGIGALLSCRFFFLLACSRRAGFLGSDGAHPLAGVSVFPPREILLIRLTPFWRPGFLVKIYGVAS